MTPLIDKIGCNYNLEEVDFRVLCLLFSRLDGYSIGQKIGLADGRLKDPENFNKIDIDWMAKRLDLKKKQVKKSIDRLLDEGIIETGSNDTIEKGYRFTF